MQTTAVEPVHPDVAAPPTPRSRPAGWGRGRADRLRLDTYPTGLPVHVITRARRGRPFRDRAVAASVFGVLATHPRTLAAVLMPDHLHWVLVDGAELARVVGAAKSLTTSVAWAAGWRGRLWQRSYFDRVVRDERQLRAVVRYVVGNPVREGLVEVAEAYPWWVVLRSRWPGGG